MPDHELSQEQKFRQWVEEQVGQMYQQRIAIDNMFQQIATLARLMNIKPEKMVNANQDAAANYAFLKACMDEEQRLQAARIAETAKKAEELKSLTPDNHANKEESRSSDTDTVARRPTV